MFLILFLGIFLGFSFHLFLGWGSSPLVFAGLSCRFDSTSSLLLCSFRPWLRVIFRCVSFVPIPALRDSLSRTLAISFRSRFLFAGPRSPVRPLSPPSFLSFPSGYSVSLYRVYLLGSCCGYAFSIFKLIVLVLLFLFFILIGLVLFFFWSLVRFPSLSARSESLGGGGGGVLSLFFASLHQRSHLVSYHALVISWTCSLPSRALALGW